MNIRLLEQMQKVKIHIVNLELLQLKRSIILVLNSLYSGIHKAEINQNQNILHGIIQYKKHTVRISM